MGGGLTGFAGFGVEPGPVATALGAGIVTVATFSGVVTVTVRV